MELVPPTSWIWIPGGQVEILTDSGVMTHPLGQIRTMKNHQPAVLINKAYWTIDFEDDQPILLIYRTIDETQSSVSWQGIGIESTGEYPILEYLMSINSSWIGFKVINFTIGISTIRDAELWLSSIDVITVSRVPHLRPIAKLPIIAKDYRYCLTLAAVTNNNPRRKLACYGDLAIGHEHWWFTLLKSSHTIGWSLVGLHGNQSYLFQSEITEVDQQKILLEFVLGILLLKFHPELGSGFRLNDAKLGRITAIG